MSNFGKKVILITGASSGIGKACCNHLFQRGYKVFGTSRYPQSQMVEAPKNETIRSGSLKMIQMDVDNDDSVNQAIDFILEKEVRLDVVVNNAGFGIAGSVEDTSIDEARSLFETNFWGVLRVCRAVLPIMREQQSGYIVNISSIVGQIGLPFQGLYCASKFAVEGMTEALRMEVRPFGIHVVLIEPADFHTQFSANRRKAVESQQNQAYAEQFNNAMGVTDYDEMHGSSPDKIAQLLEHIIGNPSPRLRYKVGAPSQRIAVTLKKIMPARLFERLVMKHYKLL